MTTRRTSRKRIKNIEMAHMLAFGEAELRAHPDRSWIVIGNGVRLCLPCRQQFHTVGASWVHDDRQHPEKVARRHIIR